MDKKRKILIAVLAIITLVAVCGGVYYFTMKPKEDTSKDAKQFASEYTEIDETNPFVYKTADEIIDIMKHGTGVVYLGYPECPWCQAYVKYLEEVADDIGMDKIYYCNTKKLKEENMDKYNELISLLSGHLQYNNEGKEWIYVPNVSFHIEGKIIANDYESSKDTHGLKDPKEYWTEEEINNLKARLKPSMQEVFDAANTCTDCNR